MIYPKKHRPAIIFLGLVLLVLALAATSIYFYRKARHGNAASSPDEVRALVAQVGRIMVLPADETPTVATVADPEKLKDQEFFIDAKVGDKVLIYAGARKAILYDPVAKKIVNVAPINIGGNIAPEGATP